MKTLGKLMLGVVASLLYMANFGVGPFGLGCLLVILGGFALIGLCAGVCGVKETYRMLDGGL